MKLTRVVPGVAALALLAACSPMPSTAAVINGVALTEQHVTTTAEACADALGIDKSQIVRRAVVQTMVLGSIFDKIAAEFGEITDEQIDALAAQQGDPDSLAMINNKDCAPLVRNTVKVSMLQELPPEAITQAMQESDIELNPRYGRWVPSPTSFFTETGSLSIKASEQQ